MDKVQNKSVTKPVGTMGGKMTTKARVQKHRAKLRTEQCGRLEVFIGLDVIEGVRELAKRKNVSTWEVVEEALKAHVSRHAALLNAPRAK
jgi:hypothetical protein